MSLIQEYDQIQTEIGKLNKRKAEIESSQAFMMEKEFRDKLTALMSEHGKSLKQIIAILDPKAAQDSLPRGKRTVVEVVYRHPQTGEQITHRGGPNAKLKAWRECHGVDTVKSWIVC